MSQADSPYPAKEFVPEQAEAEVASLRQQLERPARTLTEMAGNKSLAVTIACNNIQHRFMYGLNDVEWPSLKGDTALIDALVAAVRDEAEVERDTLRQQLEQITEENTRLTACLAKANSNHEHFEREWYLAEDRAERAEGRLRAAFELMRQFADYWTGENPERIARVGKEAAPGCGMCGGAPAHSSSCFAGRFTAFLAQQETP